MRALVREAGRLMLSEVPAPSVTEPDDVLIRVLFAGICRTDLAVARGQLRVREPLILGHELSGVVEDLGARVEGLRRGAQVSVDPRIRCGACARCTTGAGACDRPQVLGIDRHGAFAELLCVPASAVVALPAALPLAVGAYTEPLAAALAVVSAGLSPSDRLLVAGEGRIALLTERVLAAHGFDRMTRWHSRQAPPEHNGFDAAIENDPRAEVLASIIGAVRPRGRVVLKSRALGAIAIDLGEAVKKELTLSAVAYGDFGAAVELLAARGIVVDDLLGPAHPIDQFARAFAEAEASEAKKIFLVPQAL